MKKIQFQFRYLVALIVLANAFPTSSVHASTLLANYPPDPTADINWSVGSSGVADIQSAFNNARTVENAQLGSSLPMMTLPNQAGWTAMTDEEKALWLINRERIDRGLIPLQGVEANVTSVAQTYAAYLLTNNTWGHNADGLDPWGRLNANPAINACHDFLSVAENLYVSVTSGSSIALPIEHAIYDWMYDDMSSSWGHRHAILWYPYNDNDGPVGSEGFLGIGRASGGPYQGPFSQPWNYAEMIVMNVFDPCATYSGPQVVNITRAGTNPTSAATVAFIVSFSESVTGVNAGDFTLTISGVSGASISGVSGSGTTYTVTVGTGSGNGTIRLDVADNNSIVDAASNPLGGAAVGDGDFTTGEVYTVMKTPTFGDVPSSHPYWSDIEKLYANGLTAGCSASPLNFCPEEIMDRAQSSVFMLRGNYGIAYTPPVAPWDRFADDWAPGTWAEKWAEGMYNAGLTAGCAIGPLRYCPWDQTPRVQAAVFGLRLKYGNLYVPPAATGTVFFDMMDTGFYGTKWAEQAYAQGLLSNCGTDIGSGKPLFCPNDLVSRGLAAYMIVRAKNLSMP